MKKLFAFYLGGYVPRSNIELHDVVFVVEDSLESSYNKVKEKWFGYPETLPHIDAYIEMGYADNFEIRVSTKRPCETPDEDWKLYFVNFGAYRENLFCELHQSAFYVSRNKTEVIQKARKELCQGTIKPHLDDLMDIKELASKDFEIEDIIEVEKVDEYFLCCIPNKGVKNSLIHPGRIKI